MAVRLWVEILRAGSEILLVNRRRFGGARGMWTYDYRNGWGDHFLDRSFGRLAKPQQDAFNHFAGEEMARVNSVRRGR